MVDIGDDLLRELFDDESPFLILPELELESEPEQAEASQQSQLYSSSDELVENPLMFTSQINNNHFPQSRIPMCTSKLEHKYTLKIQSSSSGNGMIDDGYKWRKYGQKSIKNSPHPRSYYKCTNPRCSAKKQVERSSEDPETLVITYEGLHLHFVYPYFASEDAPPTKKHKKVQQQSPEAEEFTCMPREELGLGLDSQGLLQDMVPLKIRNPMASSSSSDNNNNSSSSYNSFNKSPPSPTSPSSFSSSTYY
ncbi:hypothetical protein ACFE04_003047 [Oxalis oulophora]